MPNWCFNQTYIKFKDDVKQEEIKEFNERLIKQTDGDSFSDSFDDERTSISNNIINLKELVPLRDNGEWDYDLAVEKWGSKWAPERIDVNYDAEEKELFLSYESAWSPINKAFDHIYKTNSNIIKSINNHYEESGMEFYGEYYIDEEGFYENTYDLPYLGIDKDHLIKLYNVIKKGEDTDLPYELVDYIKSKDSYEEIIEEVLEYGDGDDDDDGFAYAWTIFLSDEDYEYDLLQFLKDAHTNFSDFIDDL